MAENDFDIFTVSETWLGNSITDLEVEIPGYDVYRLDRHERTGGGVCAYVQESYKTKHLHDLSFISSAGFTSCGFKYRLVAVSRLLFAQYTDRLTLI